MIFYMQKPFGFIFFLFWQPPALPHRLQCSTIGRLSLNRRVRDGNGCFPQAHRHQNLFLNCFCLAPPSRPFTDLPVCFMSSRPLIGLLRFPGSREQAPSACQTRIPALGSQQSNSNTTLTTSSLRKEVIQPHLPIRLPCYDFTPVIRPAFGGSFLAVRSPTSGISDSHGVTGGVYKTRERIHRGILIRDY